MVKEIIIDVETGELITREVPKEDLEIFEKNHKQMELDDFRLRRSIWLKAFDILKTNIAVGLETPLTTEEIKWYRDVLDLPEKIEWKKETPNIPSRVEKYNH